MYRAQHNNKDTCNCISDVQWHEQQTLTSWIMRDHDLPMHSDPIQARFLSAPVIQDVQDDHHKVKVKFLYVLRDLEGLCCITMIDVILEPGKG